MFVKNYFDFVFFFWAINILLFTKVLISLPLNTQYCKIDYHAKYVMHKPSRNI